MKRILLFIFLGFCTIAFTRAQPSQPSQSSQNLKPAGYFYQLTRVLLKDGTVKLGWFVGTHQDSMVIQIGRNSERISRRDLLRVAIEVKPSKGGPAVVGMITAAYLGSALVLSDEREPFLFVGGNGGTGEAFLYNALFCLGGYLIGYGIGTSQSNEVVFDFSGTDEERGVRWEELCESGQKAGRETSVHFSFQGSWVSGPVPHGGANSGYYARDLSSLNMMRKLQLTYTITDYADAGIALMWLGQPSLWYYSPYVSEMHLNGRGYYAVGVFKPLWLLGGRSLQWDIGVGVGMASVDLSASPGVVYDYYPSSSPPMTPVGLKKKTFSAMMYAELKLFFTGNLSVGFNADLVYIPEDVPSVQNVTFERGTFTSTSVGFVVGYHF